MNRQLSTTILIAFLLLSLSQPLLFCQASGTESPADPERVLTFLSDVADLDLSKYKVQLDIFFAINASAVSDGDPKHRYSSGSYYLYHYDFDYDDNINSQLSCQFTFVGTTLKTCTLDTTGGSSWVALYNKNPSTDLVDAAATFMERYQTFTADPDIAAMRSMLVGVDPAKDSSKIVDDLKLEVSSHGSTTLFYWKPTYEGVDYPGINVSFKDGHFDSFADNRNENSIGDTTVNITKEQAIDLALKRVETFTYRMSDNLVSNFSVVHDYIRAEPFSKSRQVYGSLYPIWVVYLPLSELYPGWVSQIRVELWADSGEIISCVPLSGGYVPDSPSPSLPDSSSAPTDQPVPEFNQSPSAYVAAVLAAVLISLTVIAVLVKKRISK
jgi:hypothetical protein